MSVGLCRWQVFRCHPAEKMRDYRTQFVDTWYYMVTLLGHADVATTMNTYLRPFRDLDVSLLIEHAHDAAMY